MLHEHELQRRHEMGRKRADGPFKASKPHCNHGLWLDAQYKGSVPLPVVVVLFQLPCTIVSTTIGKSMSNTPSTISNFSDMLEAVRCLHFTSVRML